MAKEATTAEIAYGREDIVLKQLKELAIKLADNEDIPRDKIITDLNDATKEYERLLADTKLLTSVGDRLQRKLKQANALERAQRDQIKQQADELQQKNVALTTTLDELSKAKASRKAQAFILILAVAVFVGTEALENVIDAYVDVDNVRGFLISNGIKVALVIALKPLEGYLEAYFVRQSISKEKRQIVESVTSGDI